MEERVDWPWWLVGRTRRSLSPCRPAARALGRLQPPAEKAREGPRRDARARRVPRLISGPLTWRDDEAGPGRATGRDSAREAG